MLNPGARQFRILQVGLFALALLPLARLIWLGLQDRLGANPIEFITRSSGDWTLYFLCITLAVTPLRRLSGLNWLVRLRRMLGLFAFFYACLHFTSFIWFDHFFDLQAIWKDILKRPFITVGFSAFVLLIPLAVTSNKAMLRRMGRHWQSLHRLIYVIAILGILHFWWMRAGKNNFAQPILMGSIVALLLGFRLAYWYRFQRKQVAR